MRGRACSTAALGALAGLIGCVGLTSGVPSALEVPFDGPGRLAVVFERERDDGIDRLLAVFDSSGASRVEVSEPEAVRWLGPNELLVTTRAPRGRGTVLSVFDLRAGTRSTLGPARPQWNAEPSPRARFFAVQVDVGGPGESDLEIWQLDGEVQRVASVRQALDQPRWSPDGAFLIAARLDASAPAGVAPDGPSFGGVAVPMPRLVRFRPNLMGEQWPVHDGAPGEGAAPGGSYALWWDATGVWVRQRGGLMRCDPSGRGGEGCRAVYRVDARRRVLGGRPLGEGSALLLVLDTRVPGSDPIPNEIHRVDLATGEGAVVFRAPAGVWITDVDWIAAH